MRVQTGENSVPEAGGKQQVLARPGGLAGGGVATLSEETPEELQQEECDRTPSHGKGGTRHSEGRRLRSQRPSSSSRVCCSPAARPQEVTTRPPCPPSEPPILMGHLDANVNEMTSDEASWVLINVSCLPRAPATPRGPSAAASHSADG